MPLDGPNPAFTVEFALYALGMACIAFVVIYAIMEVVLDFEEHISFLITLGIILAVATWSIS